jgi:hypothetical protein
VTLIVRCSLDMLYESMVTKSFIKVPSIAQIHIIKVKVKTSGDHFALFTSLEISKPPKQRNTVSYRKFSEINTTDLIQDLNTSKIVQNREGSVVNDAKL